MSDNNSVEVPVDPSQDSTNSAPVAPRLVHAIINPAAGLDLPVLRVLNSVFTQYEVEWEVFITKNPGDAERFARASAQLGADAVLACGGDGTVTEVACGLRGTGLPMAIMPCGTANVAALELGVPIDITQAVELLASGQNRTRMVDMGTLNESEFLLRVSVGAGARFVINTPRETKNRLGNLAYVLSGLNEIANLEPAHYSLTLDGLNIETDGITAYIGNSMNAGMAGTRLVQDADVSDGLLDLVLIRASDLPTLIGVATNALLNRPQLPEPVLHWQAREISIAADPPQPSELDGEEHQPTPFTVRVLPKAARIVVPPAVPSP